MAQYDSDGSGGVVSDGIRQTNMKYEGEHGIKHERLQIK